MLGSASASGLPVGACGIVVHIPSAVRGSCNTFVLLLGWYVVLQKCHGYLGAKVRPMTG